jgi:hypothetical protein
MLNQIDFSKYASYCAIFISSVFLLFIFILYIYPSIIFYNALEIFAYLFAITGTLGFLFSIISIRETNSLKKWLVFLVNLLFGIFILVFLIWLNL